MMIPNDYSVVLHMEDGSTKDMDEWVSLTRAKSLAAKAYNARVSVVNSPVTAIEIIDIDQNSIQKVSFED